MLDIHITSLAALSLWLSCWMSAAGTNPEPISSREDIRVASAALHYLDIRALPLEDYPLLRKFQAVDKIRFWNVDGRGATDAKLLALANLSFTNLTYIDLNNCREVTDEGLRALAKISTLRELPAEGTAITDVGCEVMASQMKLRVVRIANCPGVTSHGLALLASSDTIQHFQFSATTLTQADIEVLIRSFKSITWCEIIDTQGKLDGAAIQKAAERKGVRAFVYPKGALQFLEDRRRKTR